MFLHVVAFFPLRERAVITQLCKQLLPLFHHILYHDIIVRGTNTRKLIHSLANNPSLPLLVHCFNYYFPSSKFKFVTNPSHRKVILLIFADDATSVEVLEWTIVLPMLVNLWCLGITSRIPLPRDLMRSLPFCLTCFQATCAIGGTWKDFVASQPGLGELYLDSEFCSAVPDSMMLSNFQSLKAQLTDIARFVETHALCDAWFFTRSPLGQETLSAVEPTVFDNAEYCLTSLRISAPDFLLLSVAAPEFVEVLRHLVLDKDLTWADFSLESGAHCVVHATPHSCQSFI
jgi:hypothetical protein